MVTLVGAHHRSLIHGNASQNERLKRFCAVAAAMLTPSASSCTSEARWRLPC